MDLGAFESCWQLPFGHTFWHTVSHFSLNPVLLNCVPLFYQAIRCSSWMTSSLSFHDKDQRELSNDVLIDRAMRKAKPTEGTHKSWSTYNCTLHILHFASLHQLAALKVPSDDHRLEHRPFQCKPLHLQFELHHQQRAVEHLLFKGRKS